jgi:predicted nucleic acid-binding protein
LIFDTSILLQILKDIEFYKNIKSIINEDVKITSVSVYELLRGAMYIKLVKHSDKEMNVILGLISELPVLSFGYEEGRIASYLWARLKEKGVTVSDADVMISSVCIVNEEKLVTLDNDFKRIKEVHDKLEVEMVEV